MKKVKLNAKIVMNKQLRKNLTRLKARLRGLIYKLNLVIRKRLKHKHEWLSGRKVNEYHKRLTRYEYICPKCQKVKTIIYKWGKNRR